MSTQRMSLDDDRANPWLTCRALRNVINRYIHPEALDTINLSALGFDSADVIDDNGLGMVRKLLENSDGRLRMYEPAESLTERLRIYRKFTGSHVFFNMDRLDPYNHSIMRYVANQEYFYTKQDLLVMLQSSVLQGLPNMRLLPRTVLVVYLKNMEDCLCNQIEYVPEIPNIQAFGEIEAIIADATIRIKDHTTRPVNSNRKKRVATFRLPLPNMTIDEIYDHWKGLMPQYWSSEQHDHMKKAIQIHVDSHPPDVESYVYAEAYYCSMTLLEMLHEIFLQYPFLYRRYAICEKPNPFVIRAFSEYNRDFIIITEFLQVMRRKLGEAPSDHVDPDFLKMTMCLQGAHDRFAKTGALDGVTFVYAPLKIMRRAPPVMIDGGEFIFPTVYAFNDILRRLTLGWKFFQKIKNENVTRVLDELMLIFRRGFTMKENGRSFITEEGMRMVSEEIDDYCFRFEEIEVVDVPKDLPEGTAFTFNQLKKIVNRMVSSKVFPRRDEKLVQTYRKVTADIGGAQNWRINHVFDVLEQLQATCFVLRYSEISAFYHYQGVMHELDVCPVCHEDSVRRR